MRMADHRTERDLDGAESQRSLPSSGGNPAINNDTESPGYELYTARGGRDNAPRDIDMSDAESIPFEPEPTGVVLNGSQGSHSGLFSPLHSLGGSEVDDHQPVDTGRNSLHSDSSVHTQGSTQAASGPRSQFPSRPHGDGLGDTIQARGHTAGSSQVVGEVRPQVSCIEHGYYKVESGPRVNQITVLETGEVVKCTCPKEGDESNSEEVDCQETVGCDRRKARGDQSENRSSASLVSGNGSTVPNLDREGVSVRVGYRRPLNNRGPFNVTTSREISSFWHRDLKFEYPTSEEESAPPALKTSASTSAPRSDELAAPPVVEGSNSVMSQRYSTASSSARGSPATTVTYIDNSLETGFSDHDRPETLGSGGAENLPTQGLENEKPTTSSNQLSGGMQGHVVPAHPLNSGESYHVRSDSMSSTGSRSVRSSYSTGNVRQYAESSRSAQRSAGSVTHTGSHRSAQSSARSSYSDVRQPSESHRDMVANEETGMFDHNGRSSPLGNGMGVLSTQSPAPSSGQSSRVSNGHRNEAAIESISRKSSVRSRSDVMTRNGSKPSSIKGVDAQETNPGGPVPGSRKSSIGSRSGVGYARHDSGSRKSSIDSSSTRRSNQASNGETGIPNQSKSTDSLVDRTTPRSYQSDTSNSKRQTAQISASERLIVEAPPGNPLDRVSTGGDGVALKDYQDKWLEMFKMMEKQHQEQLTVQNQQHQRNIHLLQSQIEGQLAQQQHLIEEKLGLPPSPNKNQLPENSSDGHRGANEGGQRSIPGVAGDHSSRVDARTNVDLYDNDKSRDTGYRSQATNQRDYVEGDSFVGHDATLDIGQGDGLLFGFGESTQLLRHNASHDGESVNISRLGGGDAGSEGKLPQGSLSSEHIHPVDGNSTAVSDVLSHDSSSDFNAKSKQSNGKYNQKSTVRPSMDMETPVMKALRLNKKHSQSGSKQKPSAHERRRTEGALTRDDVAKVIQSVDAYLYRANQPKGTPTKSRTPDKKSNKEEPILHSPPPENLDETIVSEVVEADRPPADRPESPPHSPASTFSNFTYWKMDGQHTYKSLPVRQNGSVQKDENAVLNDSQDEKFPTPTKSEIDASETLRSELQQRHAVALDESPNTIESRYTSPIGEQQSASNTRVNLREKHQKHLADLRTYYELEIENLTSKISSHDYIKSRSPYKSLEKENSRWKERCKLLEDELLKAKKYIGETEGQLESLEMRVREYPKRMDASQNKVTSLQYQLEKLTTYSNEKNVLVQKLQNKNEELSARLNEAYKLQDLKSNNTSKDVTLLKKLQAQHDKLMSDHDKTIATLATTENQLHDSKLQIAEFKKMIGDLQLEQKRLGRENDLLRQRGLSSSLGLREPADKGRIPPVESVSHATYTKHSRNNSRNRYENSSETDILVVDHNKGREEFDTESSETRSDVDSEDRPLSPLLKAERQFERRRQRTVSAGLNNSSRDHSFSLNTSINNRPDSYRPLGNEASHGRDIIDKNSRDKRDYNQPSRSREEEEDITRTPQKRKHKKDRTALLTSSSPKYIVKQSPSGTVEMSKENLPLKSPKRKLDVNSPAQEQNTATRFNVSVDQRTTPTSNTHARDASMQSPLRTHKMSSLKEDEIDQLVENVMTGKYTSTSRPPLDGQNGTQKTRKARSKRTEGFNAYWSWSPSCRRNRHKRFHRSVGTNTSQVDPSAKISERLKLVYDLENRLDELLIEKRTTESALSHIHSRTSSREERRKKENLENQLDSIDKELGSIRMALKRNHALKTSI